MPMSFEAYFITPRRNGMDLLEYHPELHRCPRCEAILNRDALTPISPEQPPRSEQLSLTRDDYYIASPAFRQRYEAEGFHGLRFDPLPSGYFVVEPERRVGTHDSFFHEWHELPFSAFPESEDALVHCDPSCPDCGTPAFLRSDGPPRLGREVAPIGPREIVRTEKTYGDNMFYLIVGSAWPEATLRKTSAGSGAYVKAERSRHPSNTRAELIATASQPRVAGLHSRGPRQQKGPRLGGSPL